MKAKTEKISKRKEGSAPGCGNSIGKGQSLGKAETLPKHWERKEQSRPLIRPTSQFKSLSQGIVKFCSETVCELGIF